MIKRWTGSLECPKGGIIEGRSSGPEGRTPGSRMTLLVALRGSDGMVLASDSRGTFGDVRGVTAQNDSMQKLYPVSTHLGVMLAGSGELGATLMQAIKEKISGPVAVGAATMGISTLAKEKYKEWFPGFAIQPAQAQGAHMPMRPDLAIIVAGNEAGMPTRQSMYSMISQLDFAPMRHDYGFALQGVAQYALYLLNRLYKDGSPIDQLKYLAAYVITETASQDGKVGGPIQMATITPTGYIALDQAEIERIVQNNASKSDNLRRSFFGKE